jgi:TolA-binding protein
VRQPEWKEPRSWRDAAGDQLTVEGEIGRAVRVVAQPAVPDGEHLAVLGRQILSRLEPEIRVASGAAFYRRVPPWLLAASCVVLGSVATAIAGITFLRYERRPAGEATPAPPSREIEGGDRAKVTGLVDPPRAIETDEAAARLSPPRSQMLPASAPAVRTAKPSLHAPPEREQTTPAATTEPPPLAAIAGDSVAGEASELAEALRALRAEQDPARALAILERNEERFPAGTLRREATLARAEALASLGRQADALAVLDGVKVTGGEPERAVALLRAELRAAARRCNEAINDFSHALAGEGTDELAARAFYGRGGCRLQSGDYLGARADFENYQRHFPEGRFKAEVARALEQLAR